jgi:excisionase family DNA binding protein
MEQLYTLDELSKILQIGRSTLYRLKDTGQMPPPVRIGGQLRWRRETIEKWLETQQEQAKAG